MKSLMNLHRLKNNIYRNSKLILILFAFFMLFYIMMPNNNQGYDSYSYALTVRDGGDLFHPHHLLYGLFGYLLYQLFMFIGIDSLKMLSLINSIAGSIALTVIFAIIRKRSGDFIAIIAAAAAGFLYSFWYYSTSAEVNMPALMFLLLALHYLIDKKASIVNSAAVYMLLAAGIFFHQILILALLPIMIYDYLQKKLLADTIKYALPGILFCGLIYLTVAVFEASEISISGIYGWLTFYSHLGVWGGFGKSNIVSAIWGLAKTFYGGDIIRNIFYSGQWSFGAIAFLVAAFSIMLGLIYLLLNACLYMARQKSKRLWLILSLIVIFKLFALWWAPADDGFWLYPAVLLMVFIFSCDAIFVNCKRGLKIAVVAGVILLAVINISMEFIPSTDKKNSVFLQGADSFKRLGLTSDDLVITSYSQMRLAYEYHYNVYVPTACLMFLEPGDNDKTIADYYNWIDSALKKGRVIIFENEIYPERSRHYLFERFSPDDYVRIYGRYLDRLTAVDSVMVYGNWVRLFEILPGE